MTWRALGVAACAAASCAAGFAAWGQPVSACELLAATEAAQIAGTALAPPRREPAGEGQSECGHYPAGFEPGAGAPERGLRVVIQTLGDETDARGVYFAVTEERRRVRERQSRSAGAPVAVVSDVQGLGGAATLELRERSHYATLTFFRGATLAQVTAWHPGDPAAAASAAAQRVASRLR